MTFEHDGESITIDIGEESTNFVTAVARRASSGRGYGATGPNASSAVERVLWQLSTAFMQAGGRPLSPLEEAAVLARVVG